MQIFTKGVRFVVMAAVVSVAFFRDHALAVFMILLALAATVWLVKNRRRLRPHRRPQHMKGEPANAEFFQSEQPEVEAEVQPMPSRQEAEAEEQPVPAIQEAEQSAADVEAWCDLIGRKPLYSICDHLKQRGLSALTIAEDGTVSAVSGDRCNPMFRLGMMPPRECWPRLADLLTDEEHRAETVGDALVLTW